MELSAIAIDVFRQRLSTHSWIFYPNVACKFRPLEGGWVVAIYAHLPNWIDGVLLRFGVYFQFSLETMWRLSDLYAPTVNKFLRFYLEQMDGKNRWVCCQSNDSIIKLNFNVGEIDEK